MEVYELFNLAEIHVFIGIYLVERGEAFDGFELVINFGNTLPFAEANTAGEVS